MDAAWIGVIGGAVGAIGGVAGSVITQVLGTKNAIRTRAEERVHERESYWFEERKRVYLTLAGKAMQIERTYNELATARRNGAPNNVMSIYLGHVEVAIDDMRRTDDDLALFATWQLREARAHLVSATAQAMNLIDADHLTDDDQRRREKAHEAFLSQIRSELGIKEWAW